MYCVHENKDANPYFAFFFQFFILSFCHYYIIHMDIFFLSKISKQVHDLEQNLLHSLIVMSCIVLQ